MRVSKQFDDLNDLVADLRGRVGRDGMLLSTDQAYALGTVLDLDISLAEDTPLIRGTAGVIQLLPNQPGHPWRFTAVLEFLELDEDSEAFVSRLVARLTSEGAELFQLARFVRRGWRGIADPQAASDSDHEQALVVVPRPLADEGVARGEPDGGSATRRARWSWGLAATLMAAVAAATAVALLGTAPPPIVPAADPGPLLGATVGSLLETPAPIREDAVVPPAAPPDAASAAEPRSLDAAPSGLAAHAAPATRVQRISWRREGTATVVTLEADGRLAERDVSWGRIDSQHQPRIVLYLTGIGSGDLAYRTAVRGPLLESIRVWYHDDSTPVALHVVLDLAGPAVATSTPVVDGRQLTVVLQPRGSGSDLPPSAEVATAVPS